MRTLFISLLTVLFACPVLGQDTEGKYTLSNGHLQMVIDAERGAKILSLKYDDQEVISQSRWPESFGNGTGLRCRKSTSRLTAWRKMERY